MMDKLSVDIILTLAAMACGQNKSRSSAKISILLVSAMVAPVSKLADYRLTGIR
jgi:hypothetical protein